MITSVIKNKILSIVSVFETSRTMPHYDALVVLADGPDERRQITYGKHQTTEFGKLPALLKEYITGGGHYGVAINRFLPQLGKGSGLSANSDFKKLLKLAGTDNIMRQVQDRFFDREFWEPAYRFFQAGGFTLPLSLLVIYDSYIHSGGVPAWLRNDFSEVPPARGGDEKAWVTAYVRSRDIWLEHHPKKVLRNTDYRTDCFLECIEQGNWDLTRRVTCKFNSDKPQNWLTIP